MSRRELYVGYLPAPRRHVVFLWVVLPLLGGALGALAGVFGAAQRDPGDGVWETGSPVTVVGTLLNEPYAMVIDDEGATHLLVESGKFGAARRARRLAGSRVEVTGYTLRREGRQMLELIEGDGAIVHSAGVAREVGSVVGEERVTLEGEILDSKCWLGAMKPGDGKGHKACATLCIEGGVPPLLLAWNEDGTRRHWLLVDENGGSAREEVIGLIGEPVRVEGRAGTLGDLRVLGINQKSVRRIGG